MFLLVCSRSRMCSLDSMCSLTGRHVWVRGQDSHRLSLSPLTATRPSPKNHQGPVECVPHGNIICTIRPVESSFCVQDQPDWEQDPRGLLLLNYQFPVLIIQDRACLSPRPQKSPSFARQGFGFLNPKPYASKVALCKHVLCFLRGLCVP